MGKGSWRGDLLKIWLPAGLVVVIGFALALASLDPPPPRRARIAAGPRGGAYYAFAERYCEITARQGFELEVLETAGSNDNLRRLADGEAELGLVQGGTASEVPAGVLEAYASLFFEPVWVVYRRGLEIHRVAELRGRRVAVGAPASGTRDLALRLLAASGVDAGEFEMLELAGAGAVDALAAGEVDAAFFVASIEASYVEPLLRGEGLELLSFHRHRAYSRRFPYLSRVVLGEGVFDLAADLPPQDVSLLAAASSLVARSDLHAGLIPLLLETVREVHGPGGVFESPGEFPSSRYVELPLKPEARLYLEKGPSFLHRFLSFRKATAIDRMKILLLPFLTLLIPLFKVGPPLYRWRIRSRIYRWYEDLRQVDEILHQEPSDDHLRRHVSDLRRLEREVSEEVSVPLSYMDEFYRLREHIDLVLKKLEALEARRGGDGRAAAASS